MTNASVPRAILKPLIRIVFHNFARFVWLDIPTLVTWALFLRHFLSQGEQPIVAWWIHFYWSELFIYLPVKEVSRRKVIGIVNRWGTVRVGLWVTLGIFFAIMQSQFPDQYPEVPPNFLWTLVIVMTTFVVGKAIAGKRSVRRAIEILGRLNKFLEKLGSE